MTLNIIIPTINRKDLLLESLATIDTQTMYFDNILVIDNGNQNIIQDVSDLYMFKEQKLIIYNPNQNLGVAGSWNFGINFYKNSDYLLILNDDIVISHDQLKRIQDNLLTKKFWLATGNFLWSMFTLSKECWEYFLNKDGYVFDANFYPAYFEDNDMHYRIGLAYLNLHNKKLIYPNDDWHVGSVEMNPEIFRNSMTIKKDSTLNNNFNKNENYYKIKWGGSPGHEQFLTPFNR